MLNPLALLTGDALTKILAGVVVALVAFISIGGVILLSFAQANALHERHAEEMELALEASIDRLKEQREKTKAAEALALERELKRAAIAARLSRTTIELETLRHADPDVESYLSTPIPTALLDSLRGQTADHRAASGGGGRAPLPLAPGLPQTGPGR